MATQDIEWLDPLTGEKLIFAIEDDPTVILETEEQEVWEDIYPNEETI